MSKGLTFLFAIAGGAAVGNLYWAQPLLHDVAQSFGVSAGSAGLLITVTQLGYAIGVLLIVPLGDIVNRRRLIPGIMGCSVVALAASAIAPSFSTLLAALVAVGLTAVTGQLLTPLAGDLASDSKRGQVVGTVASGLLTGILVSRTASGLLADAFGWRAIYGVAAVADAALAILLARAIPVLPTRPVVKYAALLGSVFAAVRRYRSVQITLVIGALSFAVFTLFWTGLTFLLSSPPFSFSVTKIGLVGLVGLAGAVAAQRAGRLHDRGWSIPATGAGLALALASLVLAAAAGSSIVIVLAAVLLIDIAIQGVNVLNQTRLFSVDRAARSRLNTAFVACNFLGGAVGSLLAGVLWSRFAWFGITFGGAAAIGVALIVWNAQRGRALAFPLRSDRAE